MTGMRELTMSELEQVSGAGPVSVPGGTVEKRGGLTIMDFGNVKIAVGSDGSIVTTNSTTGQTGVTIPDGHGGCGGRPA